MKRRALLSAGLAALALALAPPAPAVEPAPQAIPAEARCPVCGMYPARYPAWAAQVQYRQGPAVFLDSPAELLRYLADLPRYEPQRRRADIAAVHVSDFGRGGGWIPAAQAWFVDGADTPGPMRAPDLPAFAERARAEAHARAHGGRVLGWEALTARPAPADDSAQHHHHDPAHRH